MRKTQKRKKYRIHLLLICRHVSTYIITKRIIQSKNKQCINLDSIISFDFYFLHMEWEKYLVNISWKINISLKNLLVYKRKAPLNFLNLISFFFCCFYTKIELWSIVLLLLFIENVQKWDTILESFTDIKILFFSW